MKWGDFFVYLVEGGGSFYAPLFCAIISQAPIVMSNKQRVEEKKNRNSTFKLYFELLFFVEKGRRGGGASNILLTIIYKIWDIRRGQAPVKPWGFCWHKISVVFINFSALIKKDYYDCYIHGVLWAHLFKNHFKLCTKCDREF